MSGLRDVLAAVEENGQPGTWKIPIEAVLVIGPAVLAREYLREHGKELLAVLREAREELDDFIEWQKLDGAEVDTTQALLARIDALLGARGDG